jgi:signal transduction histidine kinase
MDQALLNALHPFSFVTDTDGKILRVGRSLLRLIPSIMKAESVFSAFSIERSLGSVGSEHVDDLTNQLVVLARRDDPSFRLRGQVVQADTLPSRYIFAVTPAITRLDQIQSMDLLLGDFPLGEPILDFLLFMQQQRAFQDSIESARRELEWENRTSKLLHKIVLETQEAIDPSEAYRTVLTAVCHGLTWEIGHVFVRNQEDPSQICSSQDWFIEDGLEIDFFRKVSEESTCNPGEGLLGRCLQSREIQWVPNLAAYQFYRRPNPLPSARNVTAVAVPIFEGDSVTAVFEFYTSRSIVNPEPLRRLFGLVGIQVSNIIARIRAKRREADHLAALVQASKMATLGEITAGVAHEINNPLYTLSLIAQVLRRLSNRGPLSQTEIQTQVGRIEASVERMAKIVLELKAFSRDSSTDPMEEIQINRIIAETTDLCFSRFQDRQVQLIVVPIPPHWTVECRGSQISQVFLNILNNAYDAVRDLDTRWIKVECADMGATYSIRITDSGKGIKPNVAPKIMSPFFTTKPTGQGTGLGLSISSNILTDHGGSLQLDTDSPNTSFVISIPKRQHAVLTQEAV